MKVKEIMTRSVAYINPASTIVEAAQLMQEHNVGSIPVMDQNGILGIVTDRDIVVRNVAHNKNPQNTSVRDVMTSQVATASPDMEVDDAAQIMAREQIRRMPVIENNKLVGIVALGDLAADNRFDTEASEALTEISRPAKPVQMPKK